LNPYASRRWNLKAPAPVSSIEKHRENRGFTRRPEAEKGAFWGARGAQLGAPTARRRADVDSFLAYEARFSGR